MKSIHDMMAEKVLSVIQANASLLHYDSQYLELY